MYNQNISHWLPKIIHGIGFSSKIIYLLQYRVKMKSLLLPIHAFSSTIGYLHISRKTIVLCNPSLFLTCFRASLCVDFQKYMYCTLDSVQQALPVQWSFVSLLQIVGAPAKWRYWFHHNSFHHLHRRLFLQTQKMH